MHIHSLTENDTKSLTSGQTIVDVVSIVKELLENSIDASSTSISITLEGYGLDTITVRDNGHGIPTADRALLARHHCTSKISSFNDISAIRTYGFRGEALFSVAEISQRFRVVTRTSTDPTASVLESDSNGRLRPIKTSSEPVGTSITISKPWCKLPVRRERFRRDTKDHLSKVKHLINTYSLVHPDIRLQLTSRASKITEQASVLLLPARTSHEDTISAFIGKEAFDNCISTSITFGDMVLQTVLPRMNASSAVAAKGHFLYVDERPISCTYECFKQILITLRSKINQVAPESGKDPFIFLDIKYTAQSYDPNIEPSKNNVMLYNLDAVYDAIRALFQSVYNGNSDEFTTLANSTDKIPLTISQPVKPGFKDRSQLDNQAKKFCEKVHESDALSLSSFSGQGGVPALISLPLSIDQCEKDDHWKFSMFDESEDDFETLATVHEELGTHTETDYVPNRPILNKLVILFSKPYY